MSHPQFQNLYKWLEIDYNPLKLCSNIQSVIDFINKDEGNPLIQYIEAIQNVTLVRLVREISQVYETIEFERFLELAKFANTYKLERVLVDCVRHNDMQITIDHKNKMVMFGNDLSESQREDHVSGPTLQSMPSEQVRQQLVNMSVVLHRAIAAINPNRQKADREALRAQMVALYHENKVREHQNILIRQKLIEDRKEYIERLNTEREEEELRRLEEAQRQLKIAEQKRMELEQEERERKRQENELKIIQKRTMIEKIQQISQTTHGQKILKLIEEKGTSADPDEIAKEEQNALIRERKELQSRLKSQEKKIDYYERAKRIEEVPLIKEYLKEMAVKEEVFWENQEKTRIENAIAERTNAVAQQDRLKRMYDDRDCYMDQLKAERKSLYVEKLRKFNEALEEERKKRLAQRVVERRKERREKWLAEKEAEKQRKLAEIRREKEEIQRLEAERRAKEREAELEKLRIQSEKQRQREEEAERKIEEDRERVRAKDRDMGSRDKPAESAWRSTGSKDTGREREPAKEGVWRSQATRAEPETGASAGKWRSTGAAKEDDSGFRRGPPKDDDSGFRRGPPKDEESSFRRGPAKDDDSAFRRSGPPKDDDSGFRRVGDDRGFKKRDRDGFRDSKDAPIRRSDDRPRRDDRPPREGDRTDRRDDRGGPIRRGGDERPMMRRGGDDTNWRSGREDKPKDEASSWRRSGETSDKK